MHILASFGHCQPGLDMKTVMPRDLRTYSQPSVALNEGCLVQALVKGLNPTKQVIHSLRFL